MRYIIIGGVAGGATAAARLRRIDEQAEIILMEKGKYISYANCGLPYYIGDVIKEREKLFVQTPESFGKRFNVDVRVESEVLSVHPNNNTVVVRNKNGEEYTEKFDKLLLSPGAVPVVPPMAGIDDRAIFTLRNVADTDKIKSYMHDNAVKRAVVIGAGFIGLEMAENLHHAGCAVSVVEMANQVMPPVDFSMASVLHHELTSKGVALYLERKVEYFERLNNVLYVVFAGGERIETDMVILSIGVRPDVKLARDAGLRIGEAGGIWVDEYLQTSQPDIFAVGDAIEFPHPISGQPWLNYLANPANRQGRIVADNMTRKNIIPYEGAIGTAIAKVFDVTVATTGLPAKRLKQLGIAYQSSIVHSNSHASYYPGAMPLTVKLTFNPENGRIFGAQVVGHEGVDKRIDEVAMLIKQKGTVYDLMATEHAYAPPFSSAKDAVAMAGYVAANRISGAMPAITWRQLNAMDMNSITLIDVRTEEETEMGVLPGALNIPLDSLRDRLSDIPTDKPIVLYCAVGLRGYLATRILMGHGFKDVYNLLGGYKTYKLCMEPIGSPKPQEQTDNAKCPLAAVQTLQVDTCGLQCPGPIMKVKQAMDVLQPGNRVEVISTDPAFARDAEAWCRSTGNTMISNSSDKGKYTVLLERGTKCASPSGQPQGKGKTFIMFSDSLDRVLATFILANGAAATGEKVTIFFTFWGLNVIKKVKKPRVEKDLFGKMFSMMLPSDSRGLSLSQMNMGGMGSKMMRYLMGKKNVDSLESLRQQALDNGVEFIACQMSMDVMGVKREELLDEVTIGGVATYMERAEQANINLFI
ncbi:MAG: FAD-dependent oxidoreductase [Marinifilaceae bacterium]